MGNPTTWLVAGLLALLTPPALLWLAPNLAVEPDAQWAVPEEFEGSPAPARYLAPGGAGPLTPRDTLLIKVEGRSFLFERGRFSVQRLDQDLVPRLPDLAEPGWFRTDRRHATEWPPISVETLASRTGNRFKVIAVAYRVGPYVASSFRTAKLLQIPAKLQQSNRFELVTLTTDCGRDCQSAGKAAEHALRKIIKVNL